MTKKPKLPELGIKRFYAHSKPHVYIDFSGRIPDEQVRLKLKAVMVRWDPLQRVWHGPVSEESLRVASDVFQAVKTSNYSS